MGKDEGDNHSHLVSWHVVLRLNKLGGFGVVSVWRIKLYWELVVPFQAENDSFWYEIIKSKYGL